MKLFVTVACILLGSALSADDVSRSQSVHTLSIEAMESAFARSDQAHRASMTAIMESMSIPKAIAMLEKSQFDAKDVAQVKDMMLQGQGNLRRVTATTTFVPTAKKGYSGLDGARKLLNNMIWEAYSKYDTEIARCTEYYSKQCAAMEVCRGQIAGANYVAANSRALILDSQSTINRCEEDIPMRKLELKQHNLKCEHELYKMNQRLKIVLGDIAIMTTILEMTDCDAKKKKKALMQDDYTMRKCTDECTKKSLIEFKDDDLQKKVAKLQSKLSKDLWHDTLASLFDGVHGLEASVEFLQINEHQNPVIKKTKFSNPPMPRTEVPTNPCESGMPTLSKKRASKCSLSPGSCYKLQERFLLIQSGIQDERDELQDSIETMKGTCEETRMTLEDQISQDQKMLDNSQTKLAGATEKEADAAEIARKANEKNDQLDTDLRKEMKLCTGNYIGFESELCALKKIRGELYKMKGGPGGVAFFQDCEVSKWDPEECTKVCAGGLQKLSRSVLTHPNKGAACLPLSATRNCNEQPCPINCKLSAWSGWSKCSAQCGGGVEQRLREVKQAMRYGGKPCRATSQARACNTQACEKNCDLSSWSDWSYCSKDCEGGSKKRSKFVQHAPEGAGTCPDTWSVKRLQYKKCNVKPCALRSSDKPMPCNNSLDIVLLLDGSGSLGRRGWRAEKKSASMLADAFAGTGKANMAVILYSGPFTWSGVWRCTGKNKKSVSMERTCKIKTVQHFSKDMAVVKKTINSLRWPRGSTLTSLALMTAKAQLAMGRKNAKSIIILFTDGRPLSYRKTGYASRAVRKAARLLWVPVTRYAPLAYIKKWATRRWQENVVRVKTFKELKKASVVTKIIADICPVTKKVWGWKRGSAEQLQ